MKKNSEFWTIPLTIVIFLLFSWLGEKAGLHVYGIEVLQKYLIAIVLFVLVIGSSRLVLKLTFPRLYKMIDSDLNITEKWNSLNDTQKTGAGLGLFALFCLVLAIIINGV